MPPSVEQRVSLGAVGMVRVADVVIARCADPAGNVIQPESMTRLPGNIVVGARAVAAHPQPSHQLSRPVVKGQPAAEHVNPPIFLLTKGSL